MLFWITSIAFAHKPSFGDDFNSPENAFIVDAPNISIVVYQSLTCESSELWLEFEAEENFELYVQLGVPIIPGLAEYTPNVAVIAEGLPTEVDLPFSLPENLGAMVFESDPTPTEFFEPFTQTESWVWVEERITVSGSGYIVGRHPEGYTGKNWLATGEVEDFSDVEITEFVVWNELVNNFHETGQFEPPRGTVIGECESEINKETSGCINVSTALWLSLFGWLGITRRKR